MVRLRPRGSLISLFWHCCGRGGLWDPAALLTDGGGVRGSGTRTLLPVFSSGDLALLGLPGDSCPRPSGSLGLFQTCSKQCLHKVQFVMQHGVPGARGEVGRWQKRCLAEMLYLEGCMGQGCSVREGLQEEPRERRSAAWPLLEFTPKSFIQGTIF